MNAAMHLAGVDIHGSADNDDTQIGLVTVGRDRTALKVANGIVRPPRSLNRQYSTS
jgi:hypothetical protein